MDFSDATMEADNSALDLMCCGVSEGELKLETDLKTISENTTIVEEGLKLCPLCQSEIKYLFVNFNLKMLTCENTECEYPFGYEEPENVFFKVESDYDQSMSDLTSIETQTAVETYTTRSDTVSIRSDTDHSKSYIRPVMPEETNDITAVCSEVEQNKNNKYTKLKEKISNDEQIIKDIKKIDKLNKELNEINKPSKRYIRNEKWLKKLQQMESLSRRKCPLLRPAEMKFLKDTVDIKELAINVDTSESSIPSITVHIS